MIDTSSIPVFFFMWLNSTQLNQVRRIDSWKLLIHPWHGKQPGKWFSVAQREVECSFLALMHFASSPFKFNLPYWISYKMKAVSIKNCLWASGQNAIM